ncbi:uncharacterized protein LOC123320983 [Coccinella septempunctata]|uniref:uncharacterized protein LOC123320983 n=1 Tax=Coccinella septempunctata TaxID=41139 RepID=UPI001D06A790|nr:uncharacterized protein LOC123320983 [Coccinella septempunctata]
MTSDPKKIESEVEGEREDSDELKNDLIFLESAVEPFVRILESWERTFDYRQNLFKEPSFEIDKIFNKFPCSKMPYALELFEADFNRIYPEKIDIVHSEGPKICRAIIKESEERKVSPFKEDIEDTNKKALFLLPYMFSPVTIKKGKSNSGIYRPTRKEVQESFFVQAENFEEIEDLISKRSKLLDPLEIPIQPFMAEVGNHFFIYFYGMQYKLDSSLRSLELLYKIYHSLNLEYPAESKHVWQVIQDAIFKMPISGKSSNVVTFLNDLKVHTV